MFQEAAIIEKESHNTRDTDAKHRVEETSVNYLDITSIFFKQLNPL